MSGNILSIKDLVIHYETQEEVVEAVNKINLERRSCNRILNYRH